jgi:branched-chain amino acid transport system substrate-binding protein
MFEYRTPARVSIDPRWESGASRGEDAQMTCHNISSTHRYQIDRRTLLKYSAATGAALSVGLKSPAIAQVRAIKLGYVSPLTGTARSLCGSRQFHHRQFQGSGEGRHQDRQCHRAVEVVVKDSQSNPNRAAEVAKDLIVQDKIDLMLVASTPETTNPVSTQCEIEEVPCISTMAPWQPWFIGRQANPGGGPPAWKGFNYTYHFFWGLEDVIAVFTNMWSQVATNKSVGGLFPNDGDGNAWGDKVVGFPPVLEKGGYKLTDPGRYQNLTDSFSAQIGAFKSANCEIVTGVVLPPDFTTFWKQALQQGFKPKVASIGKAILFPVAVEALGKDGPQFVLGGLVVAQPSLQVVAHRSERQGPRRRLSGRDQKAVDAADRLHPCVVRSRRRRAEARARP